MNRVLKVALLCGLAVTVASCGTVRSILPFGLGGSDAPQATATEGQRISVLEFEQQLAPSAALSGRDFFLPGPQPATAWTQPGGNPENAVEHVAAAPDFAIAWRRDIGAASSNTRQVMAPVVADNGRVFVMDGEATVTAVDSSSGSVAWKVSVKPDEKEFRRSMFDLNPFGGSSTGGGFGGGVAVGGGKVFISSGYRTVTAVDQATGAVLWTTPVDVPIHGAPTVAGSRVYVVDVENQIFAFDVNNGQQVWAYRGIPEPARIMRASSPAVTGETVIVPFSSGELVALRASTGQPVWQQVLSRTSRTSALSEIRDIAGRPAVYRGDVYAASHSGVFAAVDLRTGRRRWDLPVSGVNSPWPAGDVVYVLSQQGELIAVNRDSGQAYWVRDLNAGRDRKKGGVMGFGGRVVRPVWTGPLLASNRLVLVNNQGEAVALDAKTGEVQKTVQLGGPSYIAPIAYDGMIYVVTDEGDLVAIR